MSLFRVSIIPSVITAGTDDKAICICEAYVCQVSSVAQKALVFGLKQNHNHIIIFFQNYTQQISLSSGTAGCGHVKTFYSTFIIYFSAQNIMAAKCSS